MCKFERGALISKFLLQTNPEFPDFIQKWGCYFMSLIGMFQLEAKTVLCLDKVMDLYWLMVKDRLIIHDENSTKQAYIAVPSGNLIVTKFFELYDINRKCMFLGREKKPADYSILRNRTQKGGDHYTLGDSDGDQIYDPAPTAMTSYILYRNWYKIV